MSVNKFLPHVLIFPEDDANRQLANGFVLDVQTRQIQPLNEGAGWASVRDRFRSDHVSDMRKFAKRFMVLLVDFDNDTNRLLDMKADIPPEIADRVFVLGALTEPEQLRRAGLGTYEEIGQALATDCRNGTDTIWKHDLLRHNLDELARLRVAVCKFLF